MKFSLKFRRSFHRKQVFICRYFSVCIIGAGPAGFYCAQNLLKVLPASVIDIYEKLPVPFGLVRFGVAPDHADVKNVINNFMKVASSSRVRFVGNVSLGRDITLEDLRTSYNAVVLTYGADQDIELKIPGENLQNIFPARKLVGWYNGLPSNKDLNVDLNVENVSIIGQGNVAIDVARILLKSVDELKMTDITEYALAKLNDSKVKNVHLIGRRGPLQVSFTIKEFRELTKLPATNVIIDKKYFDSSVTSVISELPRPRKRLTELLLNTSAKTANKIFDKDNKTLHLMFLRSPTHFVGREYVEGIELAVNSLKSVSNGVNVEDMKVESSDVKEILPTDLTFRSIGYRSTKVDSSIPFFNSSCIGSMRVLPGVYSAGWVSTGPSGVILSTMTNAFQTANFIAEDVEVGVINVNEKKPAYENIANILKTKGILIVDWDGWKKIDQVEVTRGKTLGKPREKIVDIEEMLKIGGKLS